MSHAGCRVTASASAPAPTIRLHNGRRLLVHRVLVVTGNERLPGPGFQFGHDGS